MDSTGTGRVNFENVVDTHFSSLVRAISRLALMISRSNEINYRVDETSSFIYFVINLNTLKDRIAKVTRQRQIKTKETQNENESQTKKWQGKRRKKTKRTKARMRKEEKYIITPKERAKMGTHGRRNWGYPRNPNTRNWW